MENYDKGAFGCETCKIDCMEHVCLSELTVQHLYKNPSIWLTIWVKLPISNSKNAPGNDPENLQWLTQYAWKTPAFVQLDKRKTDVSLKLLTFAVKLQMSKLASKQLKARHWKTKSRKQDETTVYGRKTKHHSNLLIYQQKAIFQKGFFWKSDNENCYR